MLRQINGWTALCLCWVSGRFQHVAVTNNTDTKSDLKSDFGIPNAKTPGGLQDAQETP